MITEMVIDKLPRRCPYCDGVLPDREVSDVDEEKETCPHCGRYLSVYVFHGTVLMA